MKNLIMMIMIVMMPFITNAQTWTQKGDSLTGINTNDYFGSSVSMSADGNTMAVSSANLYIDSLRLIKIYKYNTNWIDTFTIHTKFMSISLSPDGNCLGMAYKGKSVIYENDGLNNWNQIGDTISLDTNINSISLKKYNGNYRLAVGSKYSNDSIGVMTGLVRIYDYDGLNWNVTSEKFGTTNNEQFGKLASLNEQGDKLAVASSTTVRVYDPNNMTQIGTDISKTAANIAIHTTNTNITTLAVSLSSGSIPPVYTVEVYKITTNSTIQITFTTDNYTSLSFGSYTNQSSNNILVLCAGSLSSSGKFYTYSVISGGNLTNPLNWTTKTITTSFGLTTSQISSNAQSIAVGSSTNDDIAPNAGKVKVYSDIDYNPLTTSITTNNKLEKGITFNNPTTGSLKIRLGDNYSNVQVRVMNVYGQILSTINEQNTDNINLSINEATGYYLVEVIADDYIKTLKVLKQ